MGVAAGSQGAGPRLAVGEITTEVHHDDAGFDQLRAEWLDLESRAAEDNIFMTHLWQHAWWKDLGGQAELDLVAFRYDGRLVGLAPTYREKAGGFPVVRFGGGLEVTDYTGFLVETGYEEAVGRAFLEHCLQVPGLVLDLHFLRSDGVTLAALTRAARDMERRYNIENEEVSPRIRLPGDWETYVSSLGKKDRHELRRKRRRLEEAGGWTVSETDMERLDSDLEIFFTLHAASTRAKADFLTEDVKRFFRHICRHLLEEGWLSLRLLHHQGRPVAAVLGFLYRGKLLLYNSGYDPEMNTVSAGLVLMSEEVRLAIEQGLGELDFLRGNEKYKYDLGAVDLDLVHLTVELA
ncbi:MAG TPA: GNAT family N-acetyltransferase [Candidatus Dormibacteraeota bacterium]|nr:GNAT family N-acetyltransferase [Candidatus Dormibacteraeota bacterium]